jgi:hypothetical protein
VATVTRTTVPVWLSDEERERLDRASKETGLGISPLLRAGGLRLADQLTAARNTEVEGIEQRQGSRLEKDP